MFGMQSRLNAHVYTEKIHGRAGMRAFKSTVGDGRTHFTSRGEGLKRGLAIRPCLFGFFLADFQPKLNRESKV